ncbi:MAG: bifunctional pyr operon transcriptional regulator/uracil phosphoribosyltransferase PyrR [Clostridia bacterium]|nr:bifunctional pyr operon transcriptional regulator/uracil phosphoribosyltransferase PyrR [Clostridia bacterium]
MVKYTEKTVLMDSATVSRSISRIAYEIVERNKGTDNLVVIGIQTKGVSLARKIIQKIQEIEGIKLPLGNLDITFYRDDLTRLNTHPVVKGNDIAFPIEDKRIILVDDVLYSGRTIRAAIEELFDMGRPAKIELAVLIDRGNHELPIKADYIGRSVPTARNEYINVLINENDNIEKVSICEKGVNI